MAKKLIKPTHADLTLGLWLGSETGWNQYEAAVRESTEIQARGGSFEDMVPPLLTVQDNVGIVSISGPLVTGDAGFLRLFGVTGYNNVADSLVEAVQNTKVSSIVLAIDSPGGHVNGVQELATLIRNVDKVKPVVAHSGGGMMSAAYWLGVSARKVYASQTAEVLSIGTLMIHMDKSKMMQDQGIKATVIRSGKYKAMGNPYEPLTDEAKAEMQAKADALTGIFLGYVADRRGMTVAAADRKIGQGRTMLAEDAMAAGGIDAVGTLSEALGFAASSVPKSANVRGSLTAAVDTPLVVSHNPEKPGLNDMELTEAQLAALANGVPMEDVLKMTAEAPAAPVVDLVVPVQATVDPVVVAPATPAPVAAAPDVVTFLQGELTKAQTSLVQALADKQVLEARATEASASQEGLLAIARASVRSMTVALGGQSSAADTLGSTELLAEHARLTVVFKDKFKVGGVAAVTPENTIKPKKAPTNPMFAALVATVPAH